MNEKKLGNARLIIVLAGAILSALVLTSWTGPAAIAEAPASEAYSTDMQFAGGYDAAKPTVVTMTGARMPLLNVNELGKGEPVPTDAPFGPNVRVSISANDDIRPSMAVDPVTASQWIAFQYYNGADWDIALAWSTDGGQTWSSGVSPFSDATDEINPSLAITPPGVFLLAYHSTGFPNSLYVLQSLDAGATWGQFDIDINAAWGGDVENVQFPDITAQTNGGAYANGAMFVLQAWCTIPTDPVNPDCGGGANVIIWWGSSDWSSTSITLDLGGFFYYPWVTRTGDSQIFVDSLHPSAAWGGGGFHFCFDDEWYIADSEWILTCIVLYENADPRPPQGIKGGFLTNGLVSQRGIYASIDVSGQNAIAAGAFFNAAEFPGNPTNHNIAEFHSLDNYVTLPGATIPLDAAVTDQRSVSVAGSSAAAPTFHLTYYSGSVMSDQWTDDVGNIWNPVKVSDNPGTGVNDDRSTSAYIDSGGTPCVSWQDSRDGDVNIYTTCYATSPVWINATCGGVRMDGATMLVNGAPQQTPFQGNFAVGSSVTIIITPTTQQWGPCRRCQFWDWEDLSRSATRIYPVTGAAELVARFIPRYRVEVLTNPVGRQVIWNGTPFTVPVYELAKTYQASAPTPQLVGIDTRWVFSNWSQDGSNIGTANPISIPVPGPGAGCVNLTANFYVEYLMTVTTNPSGLNVRYVYGGFDSGLVAGPLTFWARPGTTAMLYTTAPQMGPPGTRYKFERWVGGPFTFDWQVTNLPSTPTTYTANFLTQYNITILTNIQPGGPVVSATIGSTYPGDDDCNAARQAPRYCWADAGSSPTLVSTTPQVSGGSRYVFVQWIDDPLAPATRVIGPISAAATYTSMWSAEHYLTMVLDTSCLGAPTPPTLSPPNGWFTRGSPQTIGWGPPGGLPSNERYLFERWEGVGSGSYTGPIQSVSITMNDAITETAFCSHEFEVTISTNPSTAGLTFETGGNSYMNTATFWWKVGTKHWFNTTTPQGTGGTRYIFQQWTPDGSTNPSHPEITVAGPATYTANFQTQYKLTLGPAGVGNIRCDATNMPDCWYDAGGSANVNVDSPWPSGAQWYRQVFTGWTGDATGTNPAIVVVMNQPKTVTAQWGWEYKVTITSAYGSPTCDDADCWYASGTNAQIDVEATVAGTTGVRYAFDGWSQDGTGSTRPLNLAMDHSKNVTVDWRTEYQLTVNSPCVAGEATTCGDAQGAGWYTSGTQVTASVTSPFNADGKTWDFKEWTGAAAGVDKSIQVTMDGPKTLTASWTERLPPQQPSGIEAWLIALIVVIIVVVLLLLFFLMKRKKPVEEEAPEELPPEPPKKEAPPARPVQKTTGTTPPPPPKGK